MRRGAKRRCWPMGVYHGVVRQGAEEEVLSYEEGAEEEVLAYEEGQFARRRTCSRCASARASAEGAHASECGRGQGAALGGQLWARVCRADSCGASGGQLGVRVCRADNCGHARVGRTALGVHGLCARRTPVRTYIEGLNRERTEADEWGPYGRSFVKLGQPAAWPLAVRFADRPAGRMEERRTFADRPDGRMGGGRPLAGSGQDGRMDAQRE